MLRCRLPELIIERQRGDTPAHRPLGHAAIRADVALGTCHDRRLDRKVIQRRLVREFTQAPRVGNLPEVQVRMIVIVERAINQDDGDPGRD